MPEHLSPQVLDRSHVPPGDLGYLNTKYRRNQTAFVWTPGPSQQCRRGCGKIWVAESSRSMKRAQAKAARSTR
jgi:hypothetical protein